MPHFPTRFDRIKAALVEAVGRDGTVDRDDEQDVLDLKNAVSDLFAAVQEVAQDMGRKSSEWGIEIEVDDLSVIPEIAADAFHGYHARLSELAEAAPCPHHEHHLSASQLGVGRYA